MFVITYHFTNERNDITYTVVSTLTSITVFNSNNLVQHLYLLLPLSDVQKKKTCGGTSQVSEKPPRQQLERQN